MSYLRQRVAERYRAVNGEHPMRPEDDAYVDRYFVTLEQLCAGRPVSPEDVQAHMVARRLPLPSYLRSDGVEMVPPDLLAPAEAAGGVGRLPRWFRSHWTDPVKADDEWRSYLSGRYVCLRSVHPVAIQRKDRLSAAIRDALSEPRPTSAAWLDGLHRLVDDLEALELPFTGYDRLRFGGPTSRDTLIDGVRAHFPLAGRGAGDPDPLPFAC